MAGDITCNDPDFPFHVECKWQESWRMHQVLEHTGVVVDSWWFQAKGDCPSTKIPVLVFTKNHLPIFVIGESVIFELWLRNKSHNYMRLYELFDDSYEDCNLVLFTLDHLLTSDPDHWSIDG